MVCGFRLCFAGALWGEIHPRRYDLSIGQTGSIVTSAWGVGFGTGVTCALVTSTLCAIFRDLRKVAMFLVIHADLAYQIMGLLSRIPGSRA
jgi:hypothetical protein